MTHRGEALMVMFHLVVAAHLKIKVEMAHPKVKVMVKMAHPKPKVKVKMPPMVKKTALIVMFRLLVAAHLKIKVEMAHPKLKVKVEMANQVLMVMSHLKLKLKAKMVKVKLKIKKVKVKVAKTPIVKTRYLLFLLFRLNVDRTMAHPYRRIHFRRLVSLASCSCSRR
mmetsp:Transcript_38464/g.85869  ORF Transcript_38464/g.85869 Transcript_38464/m.85869 type:complete len:167 (-) Transcript_38464:376-876(-)